MESRQTTMCKNEELDRNGQGGKLSCQSHHALAKCSIVILTRMAAVFFEVINSPRRVSVGVNHFVVKGTGTPRARRRTTISVPKQ